MLRAQLADPVDSCTPYTFSDFDTVWVALVARQQQQFHPALNCTFDIKVRLTLTCLWCGGC